MATEKATGHRRSMSKVTALVAAIAAMVDDRVAAGATLEVEGEAVFLLDKCIGALEATKPSVRDLAALGRALTMDSESTKRNIDFCLEMAKLAWVDVSTRSLFGGERFGADAAREYEKAVSA